ncbi:DNA repair nuclease/redox regulator APEX1 [Nyctibius grandis]|uniref:DNA repair nuclease/redox regulator APEX1 n=1 Tax=Nyctibius grandis TaxID=48427 RepID=UPI0035BBD809
MPKRSKKEVAEGDGGEEGPPPKAGREPSQDKDPVAPSAPSASQYEDPPERAVTAGGRRCTLRVTSWNVDGLRAWVRKGGLEFIQQEAPDVLCLQETKCPAPAVPPPLRALPGLPHQYWASPEGRPGYGGVGLLARHEPLSVTYGIGDEEHDREGRVVTAEFPSLYVVSAYVPNAGRGLVRLEPRLRWDSAFLLYLTRLDARKPVALCGDLNVAHTALDLAHPRANARSPGFTLEERQGLGRLLEAGFIDTFRHLYPGVPRAYTFWTYLGGARGRNVGWRLDYFLLSRRLQGALCDSKIRNRVLGSDHCPITLLLAL